MPPQSVAATAQDWLRRHVDKKKLHTADEYRRIVNTYIAPAPFGDLNFATLRRSTIVAFLNTIEDRHGAFQCDAVLGCLKSIAYFVQRRSDDYTPPFARGMQRVAASQRVRTRTLSDQELKILWHAAGDAGWFGDVIKMLLLTCQRREKVCRMRWADIVDGTWTVPHVAGQKGVAGRLKLPKMAIGRRVADLDLGVADSRSIFAFGLSRFAFEN
jgi:integrase